MVSQMGGRPGATLARCDGDGCRRRMCRRLGTATRCLAMVPWSLARQKTLGRAIRRRGTRGGSGAGHYGWRVEGSDCQRVGGERGEFWVGSRTGLLLYGLSCAVCAWLSFVNAAARRGA